VQFELQQQHENINIDEFLKEKKSINRLQMVPKEKLFHKPFFCCCGYHDLLHRHMKSESEVKEKVKFLSDESSSLFISLEM
jgi:glucan phosphorylase